jgi:hypothetical protein
VDRERASGARGEVEEVRGHGGLTVGWGDCEPYALGDGLTGLKGNPYEADARDEPSSLVVGGQHESILDRIQDLPESAGYIGSIERVKLTLLRHQSVQVHYIQRVGTSKRRLLWHCSHLGPLGTRKSG